MNDRERVRQRFQQVLICALTACLAAGVALAEQPSWHMLSGKTFVIRAHVMGAPADLDTSGIWSLDLSDGTYTRLRPFYYNATRYNTPDFLGADGRGSYLATMEDRLVFEGWPSTIELDAATMRLLRRYAALDPSLGAYGWAVQGPVVDADRAARTGLPEGLYGVANCVYSLLGTGGWLPPRQCDPLVLPGISGTVADLGDVWPMLLRGPVGARRGDFSLLRTVNAGGLTPIVSIDTTRDGLWIGGASSFTFHPITDRTVGAGTTSMDLSGPPINNPNAWLENAFYQSQKDLFLVDWRDNNQDHHSVLSYADGSFSLVSDDQPVVGSLAYAALGQDPPTEKVQTIPIVAHTSGKNGTFWTSDLYLYNPSSTPMTVMIRRVVAPDVAKTVDILAHGSLAIPDVLVWAGGGPAGDGAKHDALVITSPYRWGENLVAAARVWTPDSDPQLRAGGGTEGQAVPAVPDILGYTNHLPWLAGSFGTLDDSTGYILANQHPFIQPSQLVLDNRVPGRYRFNLGVVNDGDAPVTVTLTSVARVDLEDGGTDTTRSIQVLAHSVRITDIESLFPAAIADGYPPVFGVSGDPASLWLSMVDNITGDATFVPFTLLSRAGDAFTRYAVPAVAHLPGRNGTSWTTDLYGAFWDNASDIQPVARMWLHTSDPTRNCGGSSAELTKDDLWGIPPTNADSPPPDIGIGSVYPDVVHSFEACASDNDVRGALEIEEGSWMSGYSRTYTTRTDGGTYGGMLPLYPPHGWPVQHFTGLVVSPAFRINVGLYNGDADHAITHRLTLYDAYGVKVAETELTLQPWQNLVEPLETVLGLPKGSLADGTYGLTILPLDDEANGVEGRSWAFVSLVDNVTGDSTNWW
ncbi:MAG: hypothetical protein LJE95_14670 [Acidobacteria bacterium]|nr:hypothetical protein [Acidobacteriota bacterium]